MTRLTKRVRPALTLIGLICALAAGPVSLRAAPLEDSNKSAPAATSLPQFLPPGSSYGQDPASQVSALLGTELKKGNWRRACSIATDALGRGEPDLDALGVFAMCAALRRDEAAANAAVLRLRENDGAASYYATMTEGMLQLRNGAPQKAEATLRSIERTRPGDPLALYFTGEAQHQLKHDPQAIVSFKGVLKRWPDHAPALASAARLVASPKASAADLKEAVAMAERATMIEPMNLDYWKQLADLYDRTGQKDRAAAVRLQWLNPPTMKK